MTSAADMAGARQFVSFYVDDRLYGLDIRVVKEINPNVDITAVPLSPPEIRGLVNVRGQVVLVVDVAIILGRAARPVTEDSHIVILKTTSELCRLPGSLSGEDIERFGDKPAAILVDRICDVTRVRSEDVEPTPPHLDEANSRFFEGVVRLDDEAQVILNAGKLL